MFRSLVMLLVGAGLLSAQPPASPDAAKEILQIPPPGRFKTFFQPFRTDNAAISPDGKYLAYSIREGEETSVYVVEIDRPEKTPTKAPVIEDDDATPMLEVRRNEKTPGRITWLGWASPTRLVVETNRVLSRTGNSDEWYGWRGSVVAFNADGKQPKILASPDDTDEYAKDPGPRARGRPGDQVRGGNVGRTTARPDQAMASDIPGSTLTVPVPDERVAAQASTGSERLRTIHILGYDHERPGSLLLAVTSPGTYATYSLNGQNGKLKALSEEPVSASDEVLTDRQGNPRITVPGTLRSSFPFHYEYRGPKGATSPQALNSASGLDGFSFSPADYFGARAVPLGFDYNPDVLYYAANTAHNTFGLYSVNLATRQRGSLVMENPNFDLIDVPAAGFPDRGALVFDRFEQKLAGIRYEATFSTTAWVKPAWQELQTGLEQSFPGLGVTITDWDQTGRRLIVTTEGPTDPGAIYVFDTERKKLLEFARRAPWVDPKQTHRTMPFAFERADGTAVSGLLTVPRHPRLKPIPMVVLCPDQPWERVHSHFQAEVQALAEMGFVVVQLNGRGTWGFGLKQREAITAGYDRVQVEDIVAATGQLAAMYPIAADRVALMGRGHGGFVALRTLQDHPGKFRCAIALEAPLSLDNWLAEQRWTGGEAQPQLMRAWFGDAARLHADPLMAGPAIAKPVLMLNYPGARVGDARGTYASARHFAEKARAQGTSVEFGDLTTDYMNGLPLARASVFDRIEGFLNLNLYDFKVKLDEMQVKK